MKKLFILFVVIISCNGYNPSNPNNIKYTTANLYNWNKHYGKVIKNIQYIENAKTIPGCDDLVIYFNDGSRVKCHVNKYLLDVSE